jgi:hypothetical protein
MKLRSVPFLIMACMLRASYALDTTDFRPVTCQGTYPLHLQGVCTNERDAIYWSWTDALVKTDASGKVIRRVKVPSHHGDLCFQGGRVYVAVNLGKFNQPAGL